MSEPRKLGFDQIFRRAGVAAPDTLALVDPPNRAAFASGAPRRLTFAQADRVIAALAARLVDMQLPSGAVVATQMPHCVESVVALLAILRAGLTAAPLPLLWRRSEIVDALTRADAVALLTFDRFDDTDFAALARDAAAEIFTVRYVAAFGERLPDGVVGLDDVFEADGLSPALPAVATGADIAGVLTWDISRPGHGMTLREPGSVLAAGLAVALEAELPPGSTLLSAVPLTSLAGIAMTLVPWLLSTGTLFLHHPFDGAVFSDQLGDVAGGMVIAPAAIAPMICDAMREQAADGIDPARLMLLHREPAPPEQWQAPEGFAVIDVRSFGEAGLVALARTDIGVPAALPIGEVTAPSRKAVGTKVLETNRTAHGTLSIHGAMARLRGDDAATGPLDTGIPLDAVGGIALSSDDTEVMKVGAYGFAADIADRLRVRTATELSLSAAPHPLLGLRLAMNAENALAAHAELTGAGVNALLADAVMVDEMPALPATGTDRG